MSIGNPHLVLFFFAIWPAATQTHAVASDFSAADAAVVEEMHHLWVSKADAIWAGAGKSRVPVIYIKADTEYAIGFPDAMQGFKRVTAPAGFDMSLQARPRTFATDLSASFPVAGNAAVVMASPELLKKSPEEWVIVAEHEMFHVFQAANGSAAKIAALEIAARADASWQLNFPFPYNDENVMRLIHLQGYPLWLAATSKDNEDAKYNVGTALDAVDVYRWLLESLNPKDYRYSKFQEWSEGVAKYTEYRFAERAAQSDYVPVESFRKLPAYKGYADLWNTNYKNVPYLVKHAGRAAQNRDAFYHLGLGKALALDRIDSHWKDRYFVAGIWMNDLLEAAVHQFN